MRNKRNSGYFSILFVLLLPIGVLAQQTPEAGSAPRFSFGVIGGAALTDAFGHDRTGFIYGPDGSIHPVLSRSYSTLKDYVIGSAVEAGLPWRGVSVEFNALYRPMNLTIAGVRPDGTLHSISPATVVTWRFPELASTGFASVRSRRSMRRARRFGLRRI